MYKETKKKPFILNGELGEIREVQRKRQTNQNT